MAAVQVSDPSTIGQEVSFGFPNSMINPNSAVAITSGSPLGTPPSAAIAGETDSPATGSVAAYGQSSAKQPAHRQPVLWLVVLVVIGVLILSHAARLNLRT